MSQLKPGVTYVYEKVGGVTYARESGAPANERFAIGWDYDHQTMVEKLEESKLWDEIHREARKNPALQKALEQCIIIYHLSKDKKEPPMWHPV